MDREAGMMRRVAVYLRGNSKTQDTARQMLSLLLKPKIRKFLMLAFRSTTALPIFLLPKLLTGS
jgi:hypothetical protein